MIPYLALFGSPVAAAVLFRRLALPLAILGTLFGGYLLLPVNRQFDLPMLPTLDKNSVPALTALVLALVLSRRAAADAIRPGLLPASPLARTMLALLVLGAFVTVLTNGDRLTFGAEYARPGLGLYDSFSVILTTMVTLVPFLLARKFLSDPRAQHSFLVVFAVAGAAYALPVLYEVRMSPQINRMVYGYFQNNWAQHMRDGGFRPIVFLQHGLWLSLFLSGATLAAIALWRGAEGRTRGRWLAAAILLMVTLVLSKSLGALLVTLVLAPFLVAGVRTRLMLAAALAVLVTTYPALRNAGLVPVERIIGFAAAIDQERANSLAFRVDAEERLLEKARDRALFGWGGWGRARLYDNKGGDDVVTDGYWVITLGEGGWVRYIAEFGLLGLPLILLALRRSVYAIGPPTAALALILAGNLVDLLPNAGITPLTWMLAGSLWGRLEWGRVAAGAAPAPVPAEAAPPAGSPVYTRQSTRFVRGQRPAE